MRKALKIKDTKRNPAPAKSPRWSARKARVLRAYRPSGRAGYCK
jgi:hypothetical protein